MSLEFKKFKALIAGAAYSVDVAGQSSTFVVGQQGDNGVNSNLTEWQLNDFDARMALEIDKDDDVGMVLRVRYCFNDSYLVYYKSPKKVYIYDLKEQKHLDFNFALNEWGELDASKSSPRIVISGNNVEVWDIITHECLWSSSEYFEDSPYLRGTISDDGKYIAIAGFTDGEVVIIDIESKQVIKRLVNGPDKSWRVFLSSDMKYVSVIGYICKGVYLWDLDKEERIFSDIFDEDLLAASFTFLKDNSYTAVGTLGGSIYLIDIITGQFKQAVDVHEAKVTDLKTTFDGKYLISSSEDGYFGVTKLDTL